MKKHKVVATMKDGTVKKGTPDNFAPHRPVFHMEFDDGTKEDVELESLKALFFVKDFQGKKDYKERYRTVPRWSGTKLRVEFADGESIIGYALEYNAVTSGFFLTPADIKGNNERVYVVASSTKNVIYL
ncbi:MAG: hypothetical protein JSU99_04920 [Nitrospiraceae bacterium]|nr:MAG: hypothetical protein JSU99_04920 [Nitrospiraceae bacterium]